MELSTHFMKGGSQKPLENPAHQSIPFDTVSRLGTTTPDSSTFFPLKPLYFLSTFSNGFWDSSFLTFHLSVARTESSSSTPGSFRYTHPSSRSSAGNVAILKFSSLEQRPACSPLRSKFRL